jgi:glycosyltransferase involved in cell wall biosynthesis
VVVASYFQICTSAALIILGTRGVPNQHGGFEALAEHLLDAYTSMGIECLVIGNRDVEVASTLIGRVTALPVLRSLETPLRTWSVRKQAHGHESVLVVNPVNVLTALWLARRGSKVILHMDGMEDQRGKWGYFAKRAHRLARYIAVKSNLTLVTDSEAIQNWYRQKFRKNSILISYGGCKISEADSSHIWRKEYFGDFYLVVARPEPENQIYEICEAFLKSTSPWHLVVVGAPVNQTTYWKQVQRLVSDSTRVRLVGSIYDRAQLCALYVRTRGVIHGHTVGGTNPALVDALSHGCPVFAHANRYNQEVVGTDAPTWKNVKELTDFFNADLPPTAAVDAAEFKRRYNWVDVTKKYLDAFANCGAEGS